MCLCVCVPAYVYGAPVICVVDMHECAAAYITCVCACMSIWASLFVQGGVGK